MRLFTILVQIPALDRLLDRLDAQDKTQAVINGLTVRIKKISADLKSTVKGAE